mgnify:CR=1 FL=1
MSLHTLKVAGLERNLPKIQINDELAIASFVMLGDTVLIERCAMHLSVHPDFPKGEIDFLVCPEAKAIPLTHALARLLDIDYVVARKSVKGYMNDPMIEKVQSITTIEAQTLVLDRCDVLQLVNKKVFIVDDRDHHGVQTTAYYDPNIKLIKIYGKNRALVDVLRSIAHEMTHMRQDINGEITGPVQDIGGYHENQAYAMSGALIKMFTTDDQ